MTAVRAGISDAVARRMISAAIDRASAIGLAISIVVTDAIGVTIAERRMSGTWRDGDAIARAKAFTAGAFDLETRRLGSGSLVHDSGDWSLSEHQLVFAGGIPLHDVHGGRVVGAIGVSGGIAAEDQACAEAALGVFPGDGPTVS